MNGLGTRLGVDGYSGTKTSTISATMPVTTSVIAAMVPVGYLMVGENDLGHLALDISAVETGDMIPELSIPPIPIPILIVSILGSWQVKYDT